MHKFISFSQNALGVFALLAILASATLATLSLSPAGFSKSQVAGASTVATQVLSNLQPLKVEDDNSFRATGLLTQLIKHSDTDFEYVVQLSGLQRGKNALGAVTLHNPNSQTLRIKFTAQSPQNLNQQTYFTMGTGQDSLLVQSDGLEVTLPANGSRAISFYCNSQTAANFITSFSFQIEQQ